MEDNLYITDYLKQHASAIGTKPALVCQDRTLTWAELWHEVEIATTFLNQKIPSDKQHVVGLLLPNSWQFVVAHLAILNAGHITMPLDPSYKQMEIDPIVAQIEPVVVITNAKHATNLSTKFPIVLVEQLLNHNLIATDLQRPQLPPDKQIATLLFTSGTTGEPKATPYTHANHLWNIQAVAKLWDWTPKDTILLSLPLSHWHGLVMGLSGGIYLGNTIYLQERFDSEATLATLSSGNISLFMHVPNAYWKLVNHNPDSQYDISQVRLCISGSSFLPPAVWKAFKERFKQEILERYGASETGLVASNSLLGRIPGSVGHLLPNVRIEIQSDGEIGLESPGLFLGYYKNEDATKAKYTSEGWWLTGDIGTFENNVLTLKGRIQEKIKKFGYTIYPRDVEWAMLKNPKVKEIVVLGIQKPNSLNDEITYFINSTLTEAEIEEYCKLNLPSAWRPDKVFFIPEIPKTKSGKPELAKLKSLIG
ncbi:acyl--CoA ligase [Patescibacteria group bacterium]|nr:acyl--CoA ligase [Patescibacteria group bacterium]